MFERIRTMKIWLVAVAVVIAIASLLTSNYLIRDLQQEERNKMEVWAEAMRSLNDADEYTDLNLVLKVINGNNTIPVIVLDRDGNVQTHRNLSRQFSATDDSVSVLSRMARRMKADGNSIRIFPNMQNFDQPVGGEVEFIEICYDESLMLKRLAAWPYIQLSVVIIFVVVAIFALFSSMKAEQNKVWVGLSKETAHQLGTPISSLMAWSTVLRETYPDDQLLPEMEKDVQRLERIAERFSKIGSIPEPKPEDVGEIIQRVVDYMHRRTSNKVRMTTDLPADPVIVPLVASLFEWVLENLCKNAVDAMSGSGSIDIHLSETDAQAIIEVHDTGKGIAKSNFGSVFKPGFTTKERGWGLGLSLAKRIVEQYHRGRIFVKSSELGHGTTFRIELPK
jgi:signal transduction histidine kinase